MRKLSFWVLGFFAASLIGCNTLQSAERPAATSHAATIAKAAQIPHVAANHYRYLYGLSGYKFADLLMADSADILVVDVDDAELTAEQVHQLKDSGKTVFSYLSIGEAEDYRDYWNPEWKKNKPSFLLDENKEWKGNYRVKFWDAGWQKLMIGRAQHIAQMGFDGIYLDIIDGYQQKSVIKAFGGDQKGARRAMENFVIRLSQAVKQINPRFKVIPQNATELAADVGNDSHPNLAYLRAIDGMGVEDLWYNDDKKSGWTGDDLKNIRLAQAQGKFILAISYPKDPKKQADFVNKALQARLIPFVGKRALAKKEGIYPINLQITKAVPQSWVDSVR